MADKDKNGPSDVINRIWYQLLVITMASSSMINMGQAVAMPGYMLPQLMVADGRNDIYVSAEKGSWIGRYELIIELSSQFLHYVVCFTVSRCVSVNNPKAIISI